MKRIDNDYRVYNFDLEHPLVENTTYDEIIDFSEDVYLVKDYMPSAPIVLQNVKTQVNLNGNKVVAPVFSESNGAISEGVTDSYAFWVKEGSDLTIKGDGEIISQPAIYSMAVWAQGGTVKIYDGKFSNAGEGSDLIYVSAGGKVEIYGGEFHPCKRDEGVAGTNQDYCALNIKDSDRDISSITVYGGTFYNFNPADNKSEGESTNFVAEGYVSIEIEPNVWKVVKE